MVLSGTVLGFSTSARFYDHQTGPHHPERPERLAAIFQAVRAAELIASPNPLDNVGVHFGSFEKSPSQCVELEPYPADVRWLAECHTKEHIEQVRHICQIGGGVLDGTGDTPVGADSYEIALLSAGSALACCDAVMAGKVKRAFSCARPPGHHAEPDRAMGFCLFANVSIAARYLQQKHGVGKVAIVDFDVHHGNGTQAIFEADPSVLFISIHQHPRTCYPGTGFDWEIGTEAGRGFTLNIPMVPGSGDDEYLAAFDEKIIPRLDEFKPEMLLISAGFDAHADDPLAHIELSEEGFELMTRRLVAAADRHCGGRVVSVLEGGYNLRALGRSVVRHLRAMQV
jgi:acetoin utilization deacetylase AcuC-like enzyme